MSNKIVINTNTGEMMGYISDMDVDMKTYCIKNITVEDKGGLLTKVLPWLFRGKIFNISTSQITSIGNDVILVENDDLKKEKCNRGII